MAEGFPDSALVILNLVNPKEKFWGRLVSISGVGITLVGINLDSFEDWIRQIARDSEEQTFDLATMFVPLFRVERMFLDEAVGSVQSYAELFESVVGVPVGEYLDDRGKKAS